MLISEASEDCPGSRSVFATSEEAVAPAEADGAHVALHGAVVPPTRPAGVRLALWMIAHLIHASAFLSADWQN